MVNERFLFLVTVEVRLNSVEDGGSVWETKGYFVPVHYVGEKRDNVLLYTRIAEMVESQVGWDYGREDVEELRIINVEEQCWPVTMQVKIYAVSDDTNEQKGDR